MQDAAAIRRQPRLIRLDTLIEAADHDRRAWTALRESPSVVASIPRGITATSTMVGRAPSRRPELCVEDRLIAVGASGSAARRAAKKAVVVPTGGGFVQVQVVDNCRMLRRVGGERHAMERAPTSRLYETGGMRRVHLQPAIPISSAPAPDSGDRCRRHRTGLTALQLNGRRYARGASRARAFGRFVEGMP